MLERVVQCWMCQQDVNVERLLVDNTCCSGAPAADGRGARLLRKRETFFPALVGPEKECCAKVSYGSVRPRHSRQPLIYLVSVIGQDGIVKAGRTRGWDKRIKAYSNWNLSPGKGITQVRTFRLDDRVRLEGIEADVLGALKPCLHHGREWFTIPFTQAADVVQDVLRSAGQPYRMGMD